MNAYLCLLVVSAVVLQGVSSSMMDTKAQIEKAEEECKSDECPAMCMLNKFEVITDGKIAYDAMIEFTQQLPIEDAEVKKTFSDNLQKCFDNVSKNDEATCEEADAVNSCWDEIEQLFQ